MDSGWRGVGADKKIFFCLKSGSDSDLLCRAVWGTAVFMHLGAGMAGGRVGQEGPVGWAQLQVALC